MQQAWRILIGLCIIMLSLWLPIFAGDPGVLGVIAHAATDDPRLVIEAGGHRGIIRQLLFTADGRELISVSDDKTIRIWSVSPDGRRAALARTIRGQIEDGRAGAMAAAALSPPDGRGLQRWLAVGGLLAGPAADRDAVRLHDYASGEVQALLRGHTDSVLALAFAPSGRWLASASKDHTVRLWDLSALQGSRFSATPITLSGHTDQIYDLAWSPAGDRLSSASYDRTVGLWDTSQLERGQATLLARLSGHQDHVCSVAFHPDGQVFVSGSKDSTIRLWRARDGRDDGVLARAKHKVSALAFSPDGQWLLAGNFSPPKPQEVSLFAFPSGKTRQVFTGHHNLVIATAFHPSGHWVATGGGDNKEILLWDALSGQTLSRLEGLGRTINAVGFAKDGKAFSWGSTSDYKSDNQRGPLEHRFDLTTLTRLQGGLSPREAIQAQEQLGKISLQTESGGPFNYPYQLHIQQRRKTLATLTRDSHNGYRHSAYTLTPDGQYVLTGGLNGALNLYTLDGTERANLVGHEGEITAVAVSADGRWALSGSVDQTVALWVLANLPGSGSTTIHPTFTLFPATDGAWAAWTPEGFFAASDGGSGARLIGYSINQGVAATARYVSVEQLYDRFYRPDLLLARLHDDPAHLWHQQGSQTDVQTVLKQGLPPQVTLTEPAANTALSQRDITARARVLPQSGGIGKVVWKIDGVTTAVHDAHVAGKQGQQQPLVLAQSLTLTAGQNTIEVTAYTFDNNVASEPAVRTVRFMEPPPPPPVSGPPPLVTLLAPVNTTVAHAAFTTQARLVDQGGGIGQVVWTLNGATVATTAPAGRRGLQIVPAQQTTTSSSTVTLTQPLTLQAGTNDITVTAYNLDHSQASPPAALSIRLTKPPKFVPPAVAIVTAPTAAIAQSHTTVQVQVTDQGSGIGQVTWQLDGQMIATERAVGQRALTIVQTPPTSRQQTQRSAMLSKQFALTPGVHTIEVTAYDRRDKVASTPAMLTVTRVEPPRQPALYAIIVGVNRYRDKSLWLKYAVPDGQALTQSLRTVADPLVHEIHMTQLFDGQVTLQNLQATFAEVAQQITADDVFVLYLAGHGITLDGRYHFIPHDFRYTNDDAVRHDTIDQDHLQQWLATIRARKSLVLIDTCQSGSFSQSLVAMRGMAEKTAITKLIRASGRATIVASTDDQPALEGYQGHGVFTYVILQALRFADKQFGNRDGYTGLFELAAYVNDQVPELTMKAFQFEQIPQVHIAGTDFPIGVVQETVR